MSYESYVTEHIYLSYFNHQTNQGSPRTSKGSLGCSSWALRCLLCWACRSLWPWWPLGGSAVGVVGWGHEEQIRRGGWWGPPCWTALGWDENAEFERNTENTRSQTKCSTLPFSQTSHSKQRVDRSTKMNFESFGAVVATYGLGIWGGLQVRARCFALLRERARPYWHRSMRWWGSYSGASVGSFGVS